MVIGLFFFFFPFPENRIEHNFTAMALLRDPKRPLGLFANALKHKDKFLQLLAMSGVMLLGCRSLGQKYRIHNLLEDTAALNEEHVALADRMATIKRDLLHEASLDPTGRFASRLRLLFDEES